MTLRHEMAMKIKSDKELADNFCYLVDLAAELQPKYVTMPNSSKDDKITKAMEDLLDLMVSKGFLDLPIDTVKGSVNQEIGKVMIRRATRKYVPNTIRHRGRGGYLSAWPEWMCP